MNKLLLFTGVLFGMLVVLTSWEYCSTDILIDGVMLVPNKHHEAVKVGAQSVAFKENLEGCEPPVINLFCDDDIITTRDVTVQHTIFIPSDYSSK